MKDTIRIIIMTLLGLLVAIIVYPSVHESGHTIMSILCGGRVLNFSLFPMPSILCNVTELSSNSIILIGISGVLFPLIVSVLVHPCKFYTWYFVLVFKGIVWLSLIISIAVILLSNFGFTDTNDDMIKTLIYWNNGECALISILTVSEMIMTLSIARDHPVKHIFDEFL